MVGGLVRKLNFLASLLLTIVLSTIGTFAASRTPDPASTLDLKARDKIERAAKNVQSNGSDTIAPVKRFSQWYNWNNWNNWSNWVNY